MTVGVVGGGPVGILFSKLCLEFGFEVILIDAGGKTEESSHLSKKNYKFKSPSSIPEGVHKIGGGSNYWRARISEFQEDDFNHQDLSGHKLEIITNESLIRSNEIQNLYGCPKKLNMSIVEATSYGVLDTLDWMLKNYYVRK